MSFDQVFSSDFVRVDVNHTTELKHIERDDLAEMALNCGAAIEFLSNLVDQIVWELKERVKE